MKILNFDQFVNEGKSEYVTESQLNGSVMSELKQWAGSYYIKSASEAKEPGMEVVLQNLEKLSEQLHFASNLDINQAKIATLSLANFIIGTYPYAYLQNEIEDWMDIVGFNVEGETVGTPMNFLNDLYDAIKIGTNGKVDMTKESI